MKMIIEGSSKKLLQLKKELKIRLRNDKSTCKIIRDDIKPVVKKPINKPVKSNNIPPFDEFKIHAADKCKKLNKPYNGLSIRHMYDKWVKNGWKDENNKNIKNWKSKLTNTIKTKL